MKKEEGASDGITTGEGEGGEEATLISATGSILAVGSSRWFSSEGEAGGPGITGIGTGGDGCPSRTGEATEEGDFTQIKAFKDHIREIWTVSSGLVLLGFFF